MMDDREISLIAAFRLHEVSSRLNVLARVTRSAKLRQTLLDLSAQLAEDERMLSEVQADLIPLSQST